MIVLLFVSGFNFCVHAQSKHRVTLDDLLTVREGDFPQQLSPNGRMLVYSRDGNIWLVATQRGSVPRKLGKGYLPIWSPNGNQLAYYSEESDTFQLWVFDIETNRSEQVTHLAGGIDPDRKTSMYGSYIWSPLRDSWSPDGTKLVFASQVTVEPPSSTDLQSNQAKPVVSARGAPLVLTAKTPPAWTLSGIFAKAFPRVRYWAFWEKEKGTNSGEEVPPQTASQLFIVHVRSKEIKQVTNDNSGYSHPDWSPDGKKIACVSWEGRELDGFPPSNIYVIDIATGSKTAVTRSSSIKKTPSWSPDGKHIAYTNSPHWGRETVVVVLSTGGDSVAVTSRLRQRVDEFLWSPDNRSIIVQYQDGVSYSIARVDVSGGSVEPLGERESAYRQFVTISRSGVLAWQQSDPAAAGVIRILSPGQRASFVLVDFNPQVKGWALGEQEVVRWKNHRGDDLEGVLIKPVGYQYGHQYPLIVDAYPEHKNGFHSDPLWGNQAWAARGYAVFMPFSGAPHYFPGFKSKPETQGPKGWDITVDSVMSGVDELIRRGIVDPDRMGLYGISNGGGVVDYLVTRTNRFRCAVSVAGAAADWVRLSLMHTEQASGMAELEGGKLLWDDPYAYIQLSAVFHLNKVTTPMLLAVGDKDGDFLLNHIEMYNGLRQFGQDVSLLRYPDQAHLFTGAALKDFWERENAFFDKYLKPEQALN